MSVRTPTAVRQPALATDVGRLFTPRRPAVAALSRKEIALALLVASTGFDVLQIRLGDNSLRFSYALDLALFVALFRHMRYPRLQTVLVALFCAGAAVASVLVGSSLHSVLYIAWVAFSYGVIFALFYYFGREHRDELMAGILLSGRAQIVIGALLMILHFQIRARLLYYEASYFAYGLAPYCTLVIWSAVRRAPGSRLMDAALIALALLTTGSATLMLALGVIWLLAAILNGMKAAQALRLVGGAAAVIVGLVVYAQFSHDLIAFTVNQIIESGDVVSALVLRGGDRVPRLLGAIYVFHMHPLLGIGIGQYRAFSNTVDLSAFSHGQSWLAAGDNQAINIYLELLVTCGTPTACLFFLFLLRTVTLRKVGKLDDQQKCVFISLMTMLILLNFEANYLRPYLWMLLGAYTGIVCLPTRKRALNLRMPLLPTAFPARPSADDPLQSRLTAGNTAPVQPPNA